MVWQMKIGDCECGIKLMTKSKMLPMSFNFTIDYRAAKFKMHEQRTHAASTQTPYTENSKFHSGVRYIIECQRGLVIKSK